LFLLGVKTKGGGAVAMASEEVAGALPEVVSHAFFCVALQRTIQVIINCSYNGERVTANGLETHVNELPRVQRSSLF
jgi:hypothetical protein